MAGRGALVLFTIALAFVLVAPVAAWAQARGPAAPSAPLGATPAVPAPEGSAGVLTAVVLIVGLLIVVGIAVKMFDLKRKREAEAVHVQSQIADALLREEALFGLPVTPTAHVPLLKGSPVTIEVDGHVPRPELREDVMRVVRREAGSIRPDFQIEDRLAIQEERAA